MVKRPILVLTIGYIIGIVMGLYTKVSIVLFYVLIILIYYLIKKIKRIDKEKNTYKKEFNMFNIKRLERYIRLFINKKVLIIFCITSSISNICINIKENNYENLYRELKSVTKINRYWNS